MKRKKVRVLLCAVMAAGMIAGCNQKEEEIIAEDVAVVEVTSPVIDELKLSGSFVATVNPDEYVYVIPKATAEVVEIRVSQGDVVNEGDVLAVLDDTMARMGIKNAQLSLDNAQHSYNLQYGEGATALNNMQSDSNLDKAKDGVESLQEKLVDAMESLKDYKSKLSDEEKELERLKEKYDFNEDVDEIKDYADTFDKNTLEGAMDYKNAMERYSNAAQEVAPVEGKISSYKQAIDQCEETIETLQDNIDSSYDSYSQLVTSTNISNGELREEQKKVSQNQISAAKLGVDQAKENLDMYTIKATISGVIESVNIKEHDFAGSGNPAFVISNKDVMVATYYVSEDIRNTFSIGQKIKIEKDGREYDAEVIEIGEAVDNTTGLFRIKAKLISDGAGLLSGTKVTVVTDTYNEKNALVIPYDSVYYEGTQAYVYVVEDGRASKRFITTGLYDTEKIVVTDGLDTDDVLISTWSAQLRDGVKIRTADKNESGNTQSSPDVKQEG